MVSILRDTQGTKQMEKQKLAEHLLTEEVISFSEAARELNVHVATVHRWRQRGIQGTRLEAVRIGGKILTTRQALGRFITETQH